MQITPGGCWNDVSCGTAYKFICGLPVCKREQVISISAQPPINIFQGETKTVSITHTSPKYSDYTSTPTCSLSYACDSNCSTGDSATVSISGTVMTIVATNVNKAAVIFADWSTTKSLTVTMSDSPISTTASS
jgi:hypothetical protein